MSFTASTRERSGPILPMAAMVDVLFLLLIFFMTTSIFREQDSYIEISPPLAESATNNSAGDTPVTITVDGEEKIFIGDRPYDLSQLREQLRSLYAEFPKSPVIVRCDKRASYGVYSDIDDMARAVGYQRVSRAVIKKASN